MTLRTADPLSRKDIRELANTIRKVCGYEKELFFPIVEFVELVLPQINSEFTLDICAKNELGECHGLTYPERYTIKIREDVYERATNGVGRDRLTIAHEVFHLLHHRDINISFARVSSKNNIPRYKDPEWQADAFGGELLMKSDLICDLPVEEIVTCCGVSYSAASFQKNVVMKEKSFLT